MPSLVEHVVLTEEMALTDDHDSDLIIRIPLTLPQSIICLHLHFAEMFDFYFWFFIVMSWPKILEHLIVRNAFAHRYLIYLRRVHKLALHLLLSYYFEIAFQH